MKKNFPKILLVLVLFTSFLFIYPKKTEAALCYKMASYQDGNSTPNTPLFNINILSRDCFTIATPENLGSTNYSNGLQFLFDLMIGICIALAVILFTWGAAQGIWGDVFGRKEGGFNRESAKEQMQNAIVGLLVVLGTWLVVNTINPDLLRLPVLQDLYKLPVNNSNNTNNNSGGQSSVRLNPGNNTNIDPNTNSGTGLPNNTIVAP